MKLTTIAISTFIALIPGIALAEPNMPMDMDHSKMPMKGDMPMHGMPDQKKPAGDASSESSAAFAAVNAQMHKSMSIEFTGDADVDFVRGMIPHHQGAIDMAKIVLKFGKDPETRKLAEGIIAAQEKEIAEMNAWLAKRGK